MALVAPFPLLEALFGRTCYTSRGGCEDSRSSVHGITRWLGRGIGATIGGLGICLVEGDGSGDLHGRCG
jgi:hypothetical protein